MTEKFKSGSNHLQAMHEALEIEGYKQHFAKTTTVEKVLSLQKEGELFYIEDAYTQDNEVIVEITLDITPYNAFQLGQQWEFQLLKLEGAL